MKNQRLMKTDEMNGATIYAAAYEILKSKAACSEMESASSAYAKAILDAGRIQKMFSLSEDAFFTVVATIDSLEDLLGAGKVTPLNVMSMWEDYQEMQ